MGGTTTDHPLEKFVKITFNVFEFEHVLGLIVDRTTQSRKGIRFGGHKTASFVVLDITNIQNQVGSVPFFLCGNRFTSIDYVRSLLLIFILQINDKKS